MKQDIRDMLEGMVTSFEDYDFEINTDDLVVEGWQLTVWPGGSELEDFNLSGDAYVEPRSGYVVCDLDELVDAIATFAAKAAANPRTTFKPGDRVRMIHELGGGIRWSRDYPLCPGDILIVSEVDDDGEIVAVVQQLQKNDYKFCNSWFELVRGY